MCVCDLPNHSVLVKFPNLSKKSNALNSGIHYFGNLVIHTIDWYQHLNPWENKVGEAHMDSII